MSELRRRNFLKQTVVGFGGVLLSHRCSSLRAKKTDTAMTVTGELPVQSLGSMLTHEHVMSLFGADLTEKAVYDEGRLMESVIPYLKEKGYSKEAVHQLTNENPASAFAIRVRTV